MSKSNQDNLSKWPNHTFFILFRMSSDNSQLEAARQQVSDVQNVMQSNVNKLMEREGKLSQLEERADQLQVIKLIKYHRRHIWFFVYFRLELNNFIGLQSKSNVSIFGKTPKWRSSLVLSSVWWSSLSSLLLPSKPIPRHFWTLKPKNVKKKTIWKIM